MIAIDRNVLTALFGVYRNALAAFLREDRQWLTL
jgi:hypothetical protein